MTSLLVGTMAGVGAILRYLTTRLASHAHHWRLPWGTYAVNMIAALAIGFFFGEHLTAASYKIAAVGFCGGLSTFSTFNFELFTMLESRRYLRFAAYSLMTYGLGFAACFAGIFLAGLFPI